MQNCHILYFIQCVSKIKEILKLIVFIKVHIKPKNLDNIVMLGAKASFQVPLYFGTSCISPLIAGSFETDFVLPLYNFSPHPVVIQLLCGNFAMLAFLYKSESQSSEFSFLSSLSCDQTVRLDYSLLLGHSVAIVLLYSGETYYAYHFHKECFITGQRAVN